MKYPDKLYRVNDGTIFYLNDNGNDPLTYSMKSDGTHHVSKYTYEKLMDVGGFSEDIRDCLSYTKSLENPMTVNEQDILDDLSEAWNKFVNLREIHDDHTTDFRRAIHEAQRIILIRPTLRTLGK